MKEKAPQTNEKKTIFFFIRIHSVEAQNPSDLTCFSENKRKELLTTLIEKYSLCSRFSRKHLLSGFPVTAAEAQKEIRSLWRGNYNFTTQSYTCPHAQCSESIDCNFHDEYHFFVHYLLQYKLKIIYCAYYECA